METILKFTRGATFRQDIQWNDKNGNSLLSTLDSNTIAFTYIQSLDKTSRETTLYVVDNKITIELSSYATANLQNSYFWIFANLITGDRVKILSGRLVANE